MKKYILITIATAAAFLIILVITAVIISFTSVKPTTDVINQKLAQKFSKIVRIPQGIPPPQLTFERTYYFWEMETLENEVVGVNFIFYPAFPKGRDTIEVILEKPEKGDPSIFNKVLSAVIADEQTLNSARDIKSANLSANYEAGYKSINIYIDPANEKTTKIVWEFGKNEFEEDLIKSYDQLNRYPTFLLKILYGIPIFIISALSG